MEIEYVLKKLKYKLDLDGAAINAPSHILDPLIAKGFHTEIHGKSRFTSIFAQNQEELLKLLPDCIDNIEYDSLLWIAYPKDSSSIKSDINRNKLWELLIPFGLRPVAQIAVDDDWSAMRFRPMEKVKSS